MSRRFAALACAALLGASAGSARALTWELVDVTLDGFTLLSGQFDYDAPSNTYSHWNLQVVDGKGFSAYTYRPGVDGGNVPADEASATGAFFLALQATPARYLRLNFASPLTDAGGMVGLVGGASFESFNDQSAQRVVLGGGKVVATAPVPEPASWGLMALGGLALAAWRRRTSKA